MLLRTALCIAGLPRTVEYCFPSQKKHLLDVYHPDIFACVPSGEQERIRELYHPVGIGHMPESLCLSLAREARETLTPIPFPPSALPFSYKMMNAVRMMRAEEKRTAQYDLVFISRFDVKFKTLQPIGKPAPNTLYVPRIGAYWDTPPAEPGIHWGGYSGHLCWACPDVVEKISRIYYEPEDWYKQAVDSSPQWGNTAEYLLKFYCKQSSIAVELVEIEMMLIRGTSLNPKAFNGSDLSLYPGY